jgi:hypothetical protein
VLERKETIGGWMLVFSGWYPNIVFLKTKNIEKDISHYDVLMIAVSLIGLTQVMTGCIFLIMYIF